MHKHALSTEPILDNAITLRPGLVKIVVSKIDAVTGEVIKFPLPVQWTPEEAGELMHMIRGLQWQLSDEDGLPSITREFGMCATNIYLKRWDL